jgi:sugar phosphate isomerase/epimerase
MSNDIKIHAVYLTLNGHPAYGSVENIKKAGFDGIEIHLAGFRNNQSTSNKDNRQVLKVINIARKLGLEVTIHEGWWWKADGYGDIKNRILHLLGLLPKQGYSLQAHLPFATDDTLIAPSVVYAERCKEITAIMRPDARLQTYSCKDAQGEIILKFADAIRYIRENNLRVTFDTTHVIEWMMEIESKKGVSALSKSSWATRALLDAAWKHLGPQVDEIHLTDFSPCRGAKKGRNVTLGTGVNVCGSFVRDIIRNGWVGTVVPEEQLPVFRVELPELKAQRERVRNLIGV